MIGQMFKTPRRGIVAQAKWDIAEAIHRAIVKHDLTYVELVSILSGEIQDRTGWVLRQEWDLDGKKRRRIQPEPEPKNAARKAADRAHLPYDAMGDYSEKKGQE